MTGKSLTKPSYSTQKGKEIWSQSRTTFNEREKQLLMAAALEVGVKASFANHVYTFGGEYFLKKQGGLQARG